MSLTEAMTEIEEFRRDGWPEGNIPGNQPWGFGVYPSDEAVTIAWAGEGGEGAITIPLHHLDAAASDLRYWSVELQRRLAGKIK